MGDAANQSDDQGAALLTAITDWHRFDNRFRGWGKAGPIGPDTPNPYDGGTAFYGWPSINHRGPCFGAGVRCEVFDYSLRGIEPPDAGPGAGGVVDVYLRNKLPAPVSGAQVLTHVFGGYLINASNCGDVPGATWNAQTMQCSITFLENAQELYEDGVGNDNGVHTFTGGAVLKTVGTKSVVATDATNPLVTFPGSFAERRTALHRACGLRVCPVGRIQNYGRTGPAIAGGEHRR